MAEWADIKELRLRVCDPDGVINLETVANTAALHASPANQTAYRKEDSGDYVKYDTELESWNTLELQISDARLSAIIDAKGSVAAAASSVIKQIIASLGQKLTVVRHQGGAETTEYLSLRDALNFYKDLASSFEEVAAQDSGASQGHYFRTRRAPIGGGMFG